MKTEQQLRDRLHELHGRRILSEADLKFVGEANGLLWALDLNGDGAIGYDEQRGLDLSDYIEGGP